MEGRAFRPAVMKRGRDGALAPEAVPGRDDVMLKPWLKRTLQIVGTLALVALLILVYRGTDWRKRFTPDGDLTLVAAAIAFIAVIIQIRSSSKQVQDQIKAQRDAEREEQERQKRAVATAILFEIDLIYRSMIRDTGEAIQNEKAVGGEFVVKPHSLHFSYMVSRRLCEYAGVEFTAPTIAVAAENLTDLQASVKNAQA